MSVCHIILLLLADRLQSRQVLRSRVLLANVEPSQIPSVSDFSRVALPVLEKERRPERHDDRENHRHRVVEKRRDLGLRTSVFQVPVVARFYNRKMFREF